MKAILTVGAGVAVLVCLCLQSSAQWVPQAGSPPIRIALKAGISLSNAPVVVFPGSNSQFLAAAPAGKGQPQGQNIVPFARCRPPSAPASPAPGAYKTVPYSGIVVVPGPHPDDCCITPPSDGEPSMPILKPDLRFIPLHPPKK